VLEVSIKNKNKPHIQEEPSRTGRHRLQCCDNAKHCRARLALHLAVPPNCREMALYWKQLCCNMLTSSPLVEPGWKRPGGGRNPMA
jgi:hypothetical protein